MKKLGNSPDEWNPVLLRARVEKLEEENIKLSIANLRLLARGTPPLKPLVFPPEGPTEKRLREMGGEEAA